MVKESCERHRGNAERRQGDQSGSGSSSPKTDKVVSGTKKDLNDNFGSPKMDKVISDTKKDLNRNLK